jgi:hypothetical protein
MSAARLATAAVLATALVALPVVLDGCAASCEMHESAESAVPSCHHATSAAPRLTHAPGRCGHDHASVAAVSTVAATKIARSATSHPLLACADPIGTAGLRPIADSVLTPISPPTDGPAAVVLPLRI